MEFDKNINALFVCDNASYGAAFDKQILNPVFDEPDVAIPPCLGKPNTGQMAGTKMERLSELSGRICYDSLGSPKSRDSVAYHKHIQEVGHGSVYEHPNATVEIIWGHQNVLAEYLWQFINRPGVWVERTGSVNKIRVTVNPRSVLEWGAWNSFWGCDRAGAELGVQEGLKHALFPLAPMIIGQPAPRIFNTADFKIVQPENPEEKWISMYLSGGRGFSHEMVRHGDRSAISQRSSRFCDENEADWIEHPLITKYLSEMSEAIPGAEEASGVSSSRSTTRAQAKYTYKNAVEKLQAFLLSKGVDKTTARKQARGAARNDLGNGLFTEMIFSASVGQWHRIFKQRGSVFADAEIRRVAALALREIQTKSAFAKDFQNIKLIPSPDGIGESMSWE